VPPQSAAARSARAGARAYGRVGGGQALLWPARHAPCHKSELCNIFSFCGVCAPPRLKFTQTSAASTCSALDLAHALSNRHLVPCTAN
jgi:hypothetical protein